MELSDAVLTSFYRHMWYLTEELVVHALVDPGVFDDVKSRMVAAMLAAGRPQHFHGEANIQGRTLSRQAAWCPITVWVCGYEILSLVRSAKHQYRMDGTATSTSGC